MTSKLMRAVHEWAASEDSKLLATDERLRGSVTVVHQEGSVFALSNAFLVVVNDAWVVAFTEHQGEFVWDKDDLIHYSMHKKRVGLEQVSVTLAPYEK